MCFNVIQLLFKPSCKMCYPLLLLGCLMSFRASAIEYAGVGGYGHAMFFTAKYYLDTTTGTSESAVKKDLNRLCGGKCDTTAIVAEGDVKLCAVVALKTDSPFRVRSGSAYGKTIKEAKGHLGLALAYDKIKGICAPVAMDYRLDYGSQLVDSGFPISVTENFPSLIKYLKDDDGGWEKNIIAAIAGDSRNPSSYYFLLNDKTYIWFDDDDNKIYGPVSLKKSKDWPGITKSVGLNTIVAGLYYPPTDATYFFLSNNTCFQFLNGHTTKPEPIADLFGKVQESISANKGLQTAFYDPNNKAYYFFFKNGKYERFDNGAYPVNDVDSHSWPGIDHDSFTNSNYYNKFMINTRRNKIYDFVLRKKHKEGDS